MKPAWKSLEANICCGIWFRLALLLIVLTPGARTHDIITTNLTYTRDISRIFLQRCDSCHSESASIPLTTYEETRPWAVAIKEQVLARTMPPFGAVKGFGNLAPDGALSQEEIMIISAWVIGGAPKGDAQLLDTKSVQLKRDVPVRTLVDGPTVESRLELESPLDVAGIQPLTGKLISSVRITASLPDGREEPLLWLFHYDPRYPHNFTFRSDLALPAGTIVRSSEPLSFVLQEPKGSSPAP